jgi:hypothetical protein
MLKSPQRFWQITGSNSVIEPLNIAKCNENITRKEKLARRKKKKEEDLRTTYPEFFRYTLPQTSGQSFC